MGRNISISIKQGADGEAIDWLAGNLPRKHSLSSFMMECTVKGVNILKQQKTINIQAYLNDAGFTPPDILMEIPEFRRRIKDINNTDLKVFQNKLQEKLTLLNREMQKRIG